MPRSVATTRTTIPVDGRLVAQPYYMNILNSSSQSVGVTRIAANDLSGLSAGTLVIRCRITSVVNGGVIFQAPTDGTQNIMVIKNQNNTSQKFRFNFRSGGANNNNDVSGFTYTLNQWYTLGLRYNGSAVDFWVDGVKIQSNAASGAFGTLTSNWTIGSHNIDVWFARAWTTALSDSDMAAATSTNFKAGAALNVDFAEGKGLPIDKANNATVTVSNGPSWMQLYTRNIGMFGLDFNFNASSYVTFGTGSTVNQNSPVSVSCWLLRRSTAASERIIGRYTAGAWDLEFTASGQVNLNFFGGAAHATTATITDTNTWHHLVATYDASLGSNQVKIYIDGSLSKQFTDASTLTATTGELRLSDSTGSYSRSLIDDLRLFNTALSQTDVTHLYNRDGVQPSGLILWAKLDEGQGTTTTDSSGNGLTGTLRNSASTSIGNLPQWTPSPLFVTQSRTSVS